MEEYRDGNNNLPPPNILMAARQKDIQQMVTTRYEEIQPDGTKITKTQTLGVGTPRNILTGSIHAIPEETKVKLMQRQAQVQTEKPGTTTATTLGGAGGHTPSVKMGIASPNTTAITSGRSSSQVTSHVASPAAPVKFVIRNEVGPTTTITPTPLAPQRTGGQTISPPTKMLVNPSNLSSGGSTPSKFVLTATLDGKPQSSSSNFDSKSSVSSTRTPTIMPSTTTKNRAPITIQTSPLAMIHEAQREAGYQIPTVDPPLWVQTGVPLDQRPSSVNRMSSSSPIPVIKVSQPQNSSVDEIPGSANSSKRDELKPSQSSSSGGGDPQNSAVSSSSSSFADMVALESSRLSAMNKSTDGQLPPTEVAMEGDDTFNSRRNPSNSSVFSSGGRDTVGNSSSSICSSGTFVPEDSGEKYIERSGTQNDSYIANNSNAYMSSGYYEPAVYGSSRLAQGRLSSLDSYDETAGDNEMDTAEIEKDYQMNEDYYGQGSIEDEDYTFLEGQDDSATAALTWGGGDQLTPSSNMAVSFCPSSDPNNQFLRSSGNGLQPSGLTKSRVELENIKQEKAELEAQLEAMRQREKSQMARERDLQAKLEMMEMQEKQKQAMFKNELARMQEEETRKRSAEIEKLKVDLENIKAQTSLGSNRESQMLLDRDTPYTSFEFKLFQASLPGLINHDQNTVYCNVSLGMKRLCCKSNEIELMEQTVNWNDSLKFPFANERYVFIRVGFFSKTPHEAMVDTFVGRIRLDLEILSVSTELWGEQMVSLLDPVDDQREVGTLKIALAFGTESLFRPFITVKPTTKLANNSLTVSNLFAQTLANGGSLANLKDQWKALIQNDASKKPFNKNGSTTSEGSSMRRTQSTDSLVEAFSHIDPLKSSIVQTHTGLRILALKVFNLRTMGIITKMPAVLRVKSESGVISTPPTNPESSSRRPLGIGVPPEIILNKEIWMPYDSERRIKFQLFDYRMLEKDSKADYLCKGNLNVEKLLMSRSNFWFTPVVKLRTKEGQEFGALQLALEFINDKMREAPSVNDLNPLQIGPTMGGRGSHTGVVESVVDPTIARRRNRIYQRLEYEASMAPSPTMCQVVVHGFRELQRLIGVKEQCPYVKVVYNGQTACTPAIKTPDGTRGGYRIENATFILSYIPDQVMTFEIWNHEPGRDTRDKLIGISVLEVDTFKSAPFRKFAGELHVMTKRGDQQGYLGVTCQLISV